MTAPKPDSPRPTQCGPGLEHPYNATHIACPGCIPKPSVVERIAELARNTFGADEIPESLELSIATKLAPLLDAVRELRNSAVALMPYREHFNGCEISATDFCTCGLKETTDRLRLATERVKKELPE